MQNPAFGGHCLGAAEAENSNCSRAVSLTFPGSGQLNPSLRARWTYSLNVLLPIPQRKPISRLLRPSPYLRHNTSFSFRKDRCRSENLNSWAKGSLFLVAAPVLSLGLVGLHRCTAFLDNLVGEDFVSD